MPKKSTKKTSKPAVAKNKRFFNKRAMFVVLVFAIIGVITLSLSHADSVNTYYANSWGIRHHDSSGYYEHDANGNVIAWIDQFYSGHFAWYGPYESLTIDAPSGANLQGCFYFKYWVAPQTIHMDIVAGADHHILVSTAIAGSSLSSSNGRHCISGKLPRGTTNNIEYRVRVDYSYGHILGIQKVTRTIY